MRLLPEAEGSPAPASLPGDGRSLVAFLSFAISRGFGATHPLIALADRLHAVHHVPLGPLTAFYDAEEEDAEDREKRGLTWQSPADLAASLHRLLSAIDSDEQCQALLKRAAAEDLPAQARSLIAFLESVPPGKRVRLGYEL